MKSRASLLLALPILLAAQMPEASAPDRPRATAGNGDGTAYDGVGYALIGASDGMTAAHAGLPIGSVAEVTALDSGRIVLVRIVASIQDGEEGEIALSRGAAQALGLVSERDAVRVRGVTASAADIAALNAGGSAAPRLPAPQGLLRALRRTLPALPAGDTVVTTSRVPRRASPTRIATAPAAVTKLAPPKPSAKAAPVAALRARGSSLVQVVALRDEQRARSLARTLRGQVEQAGGLWRVRLGPFANRIAAQRARDAAISRGYEGASIISAP